MSVRKPFSKQLYDAFDTPAKEKVSNYLKSVGHSIDRVSENYYADIVSSKGEFTYLSEVEVKLGWKGDWNTSWTEIRIPERKSRLLEKYKDSTSVLNFYVLRGDMEYAWRIKDTLLTQESLREAKGRWIKPGEQFFHIPYKQAELIKL